MFPNNLCLWNGFEYCNLIVTLKVLSNFWQCWDVCAKWVSSVCYACAKVLIQVTFAILNSALRCPNTLTHSPCEECLALLCSVQSLSMSLSLVPVSIPVSPAGHKPQRIQRMWGNPRTPGSDSWARSMTSWQSASRAMMQVLLAVYTARKMPQLVFALVSKSYFAHKQIPTCWPFT